LQTSTAIAGDDRTEIEAAVASLAADADVLITSGGAWTSERDLIIAVMESAGWEGIYHRVRMGPGKGIGFGLLGRKPMFCLPGGPPSCEIAFLQLALPGILKMQGLPGPAFSTVEARLDGVVRGQSDWTQFIHAALTTEEGQLVVRPAKLRSRLQSMARKNALIVISEGVEELSAGARIQVQDLRQVEG
jgi:molybdopterin molybdotransferase